MLCDLHIGQRETKENWNKVRPVKNVESKWEFSSFLKFVSEFGFAIGGLEILIFLGLVLTDLVLF